MRRGDAGFAGTGATAGPGGYGDGGSLRGGVLMIMHKMGHGGADRVGVFLANGFVAAGIATGIAVLASGGEGQDALLDLCSPEVLLSFAGAPILSRKVELARGLPFIRRRIAASRPAVVLALGNNVGLVTALAASVPRRGGPRYAIKTTNPVLRPRDRGWLTRLYRRSLYRLIFGSFDRVVTLTDAERTLLSGMYPRLATRFHTTPNAYVSDAMMADAEPDVKPSGPPELITLARMVPQKRLDLLLSAFARLRAKEARLTILGDGPERPRLEARAAALGVADRVDMPGFVEDVVPWLRGSDLFVLSSNYEGLPAAVLEALACDVPVVTTASFEGARELLDGAEGCAVTPMGDADALANAIDASLAAPARPSGLRDLARAYGVEAAVAAHLDALRPLFDQAAVRTPLSMTRERP